MEKFFLWLVLKSSKVLWSDSSHPLVTPSRGLVRLVLYAFCLVSYGIPMYHTHEALWDKGSHGFPMVFYVYFYCITPHEALWDKG